MAALDELITAIKRRDIAALKLLGAATKRGTRP